MEENGDWEPMGIPNGLLLENACGFLKLLGRMGGMHGSLDAPACKPG